MSDVPLIVGDVARWYAVTSLSRRLRGPGTPER